MVTGPFLWQGATRALMPAKIRSRLPALEPEISPRGPWAGSPKKC
jgi:hypothetical protein